MMKLVLASVLVLADRALSGSKEARHIDSSPSLHNIDTGHLELASSLSGGGLFPDNEEGTDQNDISERVLHLGPDSLGEFKETFKNGFQDRSDWVPIPIKNPNETEPQHEQIKRYDSYVTPGGGTYTNHNLETIYYQKPINPSYKEDVPVYIPTDGVANNPIYTGNYQDPIPAVPSPVHVHVEEYCQTKGSYCLCHYCKCEKGLINCKNPGYGEPASFTGRLMSRMGDLFNSLTGNSAGVGKKYCYGDSEGEFCSCDFCKCQHGYGVKGYGKCVH